MSDPRVYGITTRARELLAVIREWRTLHGVTPTYEQMAVEIGLASRSGVHRLIKQLADRGLVRRLPGCHQSVALIEPQTISLPEDVALTLRHAARAAGRSPEEHAAAVLRQHCQTTPSPF